MVDRAVHLDHVERRSVHIDDAVHTGDDALAHGKRQLAEGIADGGYRFADVQLGRVAQRHRGELFCVDLDHGDVVILVAADDLAVQHVAVVERDLDVAGVLDDVVVGEDIAVVGDDEAAASRRVLHGLTVDVGGVDGGVDGDHAVDRGGVDLRHGQLALAVHLHGHDLRHLAGADLDVGLAAQRCADHVDSARADQSADERAAEHQRDGLDCRAVPFFRRLVRLDRLFGVVSGIDGLDQIAVSLAVIILVGFIVIVIHAASSFISDRRPAIDPSCLRSSS